MASSQHSVPPVLPEEIAKATETVRAIVQGEMDELMEQNAILDKQRLKWERLAMDRGFALEGLQEQYNTELNLQLEARAQVIELKEQHEALLAEWRDYKATTQDVIDALEEQLEAAREFAADKQTSLVSQWREEAEAQQGRWLEERDKREELQEQLETLRDMLTEADDQLAIENEKRPNHNITAVRGRIASLLTSAPAPAAPSDGMVGAEGSSPASGVAAPTRHGDLSATPDSSAPVSSSVLDKREDGSEVTRGWSGAGESSPASSLVSVEEDERRMRWADPNTQSPASEPTPLQRAYGGKVRTVSTDPSNQESKP